MGPHCNDLLSPGPQLCPETVAWESPARPGKLKGCRGGCWAIQMWAGLTMIPVSLMIGRHSGPCGLGRSLYCNTDRSGHYELRQRRIICIAILSVDGP